ncbi:MAG: extracellular solute-binding protein [Thermoguttaceae bacterium]|nr:extracellular solute-binding protein [Thermoguttaceae bacterium]MDW8037927.1 extracellular solute-binding protein [Thermoguttaceae bacterium]
MMDKVFPKIIRHVTASDLGLWLGGIACLVAAIGLWGCQWRSSNEVVVYTTLAKELVEPIFQKFTAKTGIQVKRLGPEDVGCPPELLHPVQKEQGRPSWDLVWHVEPVQMALLREKNLLAAYNWPQTERFSQWAKSPDGRWHGLAARARVLLLYSPAFKDQRPDQMPSSILDLANPKYRGKVAMADPNSPTSAAHVACLFALWGLERTKQFLSQLRENQVQFFHSEADTAQQVAEGRCLLALTDSDQAIRQIEKGSPVLLVYPDQREDQMGCLFLPSTIAIIRGARNSQAARQLANYLLAPEVETQLANGPAALVPLNYEVTAFSRIRGPDDIKAMKVDFQTAANHWHEGEKLLWDIIPGKPEH